MKRWNALTAASLITIAGATVALAFDPSQYQAVKNGQIDCPWCNLSGSGGGPVSRVMTE